MTRKLTFTFISMLDFFDEILRDASLSVRIHLVCMVLDFLVTYGVVPP